jgi:ATP-dependent DNA helicase RecG
VAEAERLASGEFADHRLAVLHGQMRSAAKAEVMDRFNAGELDVLVATSVIEVGIDVPNAAVMLIEDADRYGLSQLHQLRGRIGRGVHSSFCILFADPETERAAARLQAISASADGFELAEIDLNLRGEGEVLGTRQSGLPGFRVASLPEDAQILAEARADLIELLEQHGELSAPGLGPLAEVVRARFGDERVEPIVA